MLVRIKPCMFYKFAKLLTTEFQVSLPIKKKIRDDISAITKFFGDLNHFVEEGKEGGIKVKKQSCGWKKLIRFPAGI